MQYRLRCPFVGPVPGWLREGGGAIEIAVPVDRASTGWNLEGSGAIKIAVRVGGAGTGWY